MKKLLILSASTGSGHTRAGEALVETAKEQFPNLEVKHIDVLDYVTAPIKRAIFHSYDILVKQAPELWGIFYDKSNNEALLKKLREITNKLNRFNASKLYKLTSEFKPDYILDTHFYGSQLVLNAPKKYKMPPVGIVVTDYQKHALLHMPNIDHYFVPTEQLAKLFAGLNIPKENITPSGIPILPTFLKKHNKLKARKKCSLPENMPTLLLLAGGQGMGKITNILELLLTADLPWSIIAIAGNNKKLEKKLKNYTPLSITKLKVLGWTNNIQDYMASADIVVTKPGGLTTSECIAMQKPIIASSPIPGQEERNAEYILSNGYGRAITEPAELLELLKINISNIAPEIKNAPANTAAYVILKKTESIIAGK